MTFKYTFDFTKMSFTKCVLVKTALAGGLLIGAGALGGIIYASYYYPSKLLSPVLGPIGATTVGIVTASGISYLSTKIKVEYEDGHE